MTRPKRMDHDADLLAVVYDPPRPGVPHMAVLFDADGQVVGARPVDSIKAGEAALALLVSQMTGKQSSDAVIRDLGCESAGSAEPKATPRPRRRRPSR